MENNNQFSQQIHDGIENYYRPRLDQDIDLVEEVRRSLIESGLAHNVAAGFDNSRFIIEAKGKPSHIQRFLLNRYWNHQLIASPTPSIEERYCLIPNGEVSDWLRLFKSKVLPFAIANNLPISS